MSLVVFGREIRERRERERERERENLLKNCPKFFFWLQNEGSRGFYIEKVTFQLLVHLVGPLATLLTLAILAFSQFNFGRVFEGLS